jgi:hypothetical protein
LEIGGGCGALIVDGLSSTFTVVLNACVVLKGALDVVGFCVVEVVVVIHDDGILDRCVKSKLLILVLDSAPILGLRLFGP